jgi:hypothetical protein
MINHLSHMSDDEVLRFIDRTFKNGEKQGAESVRKAVERTLNTLLGYFKAGHNEVDLPVMLPGHFLEKVGAPFTETRLHTCRLDYYTVLAFMRIFGAEPL